MFIFLLLACITEANFADRMVGVACARTEECHKSDFERAYDDQQECVDDTVELIRDVVDCYNEHCEFDGQAAGAYLSEARSSNCDDADQASVDFGDVYDDCDDLDLYACFLGG